MALKRIQRKRIKGWRMPANTIYVGRPTRWGNPYRPDDGIQRSVSDYEFLIESLSPDAREALLAPLRGKNLACWCKPGEPCHADILLRLANAKIESPRISCHHCGSYSVNQTRTKPMDDLCEYRCSDCGEYFVDKPLSAVQ